MNRDRLGVSGLHNPNGTYVAGWHRPDPVADPSR